jgi:DNA repair exonuclease SbcCD ATPase subunit
MPPRQQIQPESLSEAEKDRQLAMYKAECKSMRRQVTALRRSIHKLQSGKGYVETEVALLSEPAKPRCPYCPGTKIDTVKMSYKNAHKCRLCGELWLTEPDNG